LIDVLNELKSAEVAIVYATPHSIECRRVADTCTIMRDGQSVATGDIRPVGDADLFKLMTDREPAELYIRSPRVRGAPVIEIRNLQVGVGTVSFVVHQKEIFGLFGLPGSGRTGLFRSLFGIETPQSGEILIGEIERTGSSPTERWREGIGFLPQGGVDAGILPNRTVSQNLLLTRMDAIGSEWFVRERSERHMALDWMEHTDVRAASDLEIAANLSSGSRRRLAAGRLYYHQSQLFLMDEPCRGVDLTSRTQMYRRMDKAACAGRSFLIGSSNPQELLGICDTIGVMNEGSLAEIRPAREWTEEALWHRAGR
jgi:ribose transport system ATP-binding protein